MAVICFAQRAMAYRDIRRQQLFVWAGGVLLVGLATVGATVTLPAMQKQLFLDDLRLARLESEARSVAASKPVIADEALHNHLSEFNRLADIADDMRALSSANAVTLSSATFKPLPDISIAKIGRITINARLTGGYLSIKRIVSDLMAVHVGLALNSLSVRRSSTGQQNVEVDLMFTYFYRKA
jgi:hypothetical protein